MFGSLAFAVVWMSTPLAIGRDVALQWVQGDGASTCIGDRELAAAVAARLGNAPARGQTRLVIDGEDAGNTVCHGFFAQAGTYTVHALHPRYQATFTLANLFERSDNSAPPGAPIAGTIVGCVDKDNP